MRNTIQNLSNLLKILAVVFTAGISNTFAQGNNRVVVNFPDFSDLSALTLSGSTANYGNPVQSGGQPVMRLTNASGGQAGGVFLTEPVTLQNNASFSTYFTFQITGSAPWGDGDGPGADGLVFVVQTESNQFGQSGGGMGYYTIDRSVGIEFDTYNNGYWDGYNGNHVGIDFNGSLESVERYNVGTRMNDGNVWHAWVDYDGSSQTLEVRIAQNDSRPANAQISRNVDLPSYLQQDEAYVGFTAATGGAWGAHDIRSWYFTNEFAPVVEVPTQVSWQDNGHIYEAVPVAGGLTWPEANDLANAMSYTDANGNYWYAHLLTVTSAEENQFIVDNFQNALQNIYFLGGYQPNHDNEPAGGWAWVTGEAWSYTNWGGYEPNNQYNNEEIIHFWNLNGGWNDHTRAVRLSGYMVEYEIQAQTAPEITLSTAALDFGGILINTTSDLTFEIANDGDADLDVSDISVSGAGFSTNFGGAFTLAPGATQTVTVTFAPNAVGNYSGAVTVSSNDSDEGTLSVNLTGVGTAPDISVSPVSIDFGSVVYGNSANGAFTVSNVGTADLHYNVSAVNGANFSMFEASGAYTLTPGSSANFNLTFSANALGAFNGSVDITSDDQSNGNATVALTGVGIAPDISVSPLSIDFGSVLVGQSGSGSFTVSNVGTSNLHFTVPAATGEGFAVADAGDYTLAIGGSQNFDVTFTPGAFGAVSGVVAITSDDPFDGEPVVALTGTGIGPIITIDPATLAFGVVEYWRTPTLSFTVTNEGTAPGTLAELTGAAAPFSVPFSAVTLNIGESATFTVTYSAATLGDFTGTLALVSDDPFNPSQEIALSGTTVWVTPAELLPRLCEVVQSYGPADCGDCDDDDHHDGDHDRGHGNDDDHDDDDNPGRGNGNHGDDNDHHGDRGDDDDDDDDHGNVADYELSCEQVQELCEELLHAVRDLEHHEADHAVRTLNRFIEKVNCALASGDLTAEEGATLINEANFIISLIEAFNPEAIFEAMDSQIDQIKRGLGRNRNRLNTLSDKLGRAESAWEHDNINSTLTYLGQFNTEANRLATAGTITAAAAGQLITQSNQVATLIQTYAIAGDESKEVALVELLPTEVKLAGAYPNPFNSAATLRYALPETGRVEMSVFDLTGREVTRLVSGEIQAGYHSITVDGNDLRSGVYLVRLSALGQSQTVKITYIK